METIQASSYTSLRPYSASKQASFVAVLERVITALPSAVHPLQRELLLKAFLEDLKSGELAAEVNLLVLTAIKTLGRNPVSSEILAEDDSLITLLRYASLPSSDHYASSPPRASSPSKSRTSLSLHRPSISSSSPPHGFGSPTSLEALRILANCLLLHEKAREGLIRVGGGEGLVWGLGVENGLTKSGNAKRSPSSTKEDGQPAPPTPEMCFILGRILFLATASSSSFILSAVDDLGLLPVIVNRLSHPPIPAPPADPTPEILKLTFNILLYYPKLSPSRVSLLPDGSYENGISGDDGSDGSGRAKRSIIGDLWDERLDCLLEPLVSLLCTYPFPSSSLTSLPLPSTLTQTINALLTFPTNPLASIWCPPPSPKASLSSSTSSSLFSRFTSSPSRSRSPSPAPEIDVAKRLVELAESLTKPWGVPSKLDEDGLEIDSEDGKGRGKGVKEVEEGLAVLFLVLARACSVEAIRAKVKQAIVPDDLDRAKHSIPLERRTDLLGRMLRLMVSPIYDQTKIAVGEVFFALAGRSASTMSTLIGYGNAAGFLFAKGFTSIPEPSSSSPPTSSSSSPSKPFTAPSSNPKATTDTPKKPLNPISGLNYTSSPTDDTTMTDEEKEREAERLFVLFQRLEKNPSVSVGTPGKGEGVKNPVREAVESGRFADLDEDPAETKRQLAEQDERDEQEAIREMKVHRARKAAAASKPKQPEAAE